MIEERLGDAKAMVVVWSAAMRSEWAQAEADRARVGRKIVQLRIDDAKLPMPFDRIQCANLIDWTGDLDAQGWRARKGAAARGLIGKKAPRATVCSSSLSLLRE